MATWIPRSAGIDVPSLKLIHSLGLDFVKRLSINIYFDAPNSINAEPMMHEEPSDSVTKTNDGAEASSTTFRCSACSGKAGTCFFLREAQVLPSKWPLLRGKCTSRIPFLKRIFIFFICTGTGMRDRK